MKLLYNFGLLLKVILFMEPAPTKAILSLRLPTIVGVLIKISIHLKGELIKHDI